MKLTQAQRKIVAGVAARKRVKAIARERRTSRQAVEQLLCRIRKQLGLRKTRHIPGELEYRSWG